MSIEIDSGAPLWLAYCEKKEQVETLQEENAELRATLAEAQSQLNLATQYLTQYRELAGYSELAHEDALLLLFAEQKGSEKWKQWYL